MFRFFTSLSLSHTHTGLWCYLFYLLEMVSLHVLVSWSGSSLHKLSPTWHIRSNQAKQHDNSLWLLRTQTKKIWWRTTRLCTHRKRRGRVSAHYVARAIKVTQNTKQKSKPWKWSWSKNKTYLNNFNGSSNGHITCYWLYLLI